MSIPMPNSAIQNTQHHPAVEDDEIDLRELFNTLWNGKILITAIVGLMTAGGLIYAFSAPQEWSTKAIVVEASPVEVEQLRQKLERMVVTTTINNNNNNNNNNTDFLALFSEEKLFTDFIQAFDSFDNKATFLKENGYLPIVDNHDKNAFRKTVSNAVKGISATQKKNDKFYTLSFAADNATDAATRMNEYLSFLCTRQFS